MPDGRSGNGPTRPVEGAVGPARGSRRAGVRRGCPRARSVSAPGGLRSPAEGRGTRRPSRGRRRRRVRRPLSASSWRARSKATSGVPLQRVTEALSSLANHRRGHAVSASGGRAPDPAPRPRPTPTTLPRTALGPTGVVGGTLSAIDPGCTFANRSPCATDDRFGSVGRGGRPGGRRGRCAVAAPGRRSQGLELGRARKPTRSGVDGLAPPAGRARGSLRGPRWGQA